MEDKQMSGKELSPNGSSVKKCVVVFGGSRCVAGSQEFEEARLLGSLLAETGFDVLTGGYTGVMEAASLGASEAAGAVRAITLKAWGPPNKYVTKFDEVDDLFERQKRLVQGSDAFIALYGGPGTLSEVSLVWALNQSGLMRPPKPLILIGEPWREIVHSWSRFLHANEEDLSFLALAADVQSAVQLLDQHLRL
jgi:uncharacterized protein (TIGR00730 family)